MKKIILFCTIAVITFLPSISFAQYTDNDLLIEKMVEKGYLSPIEATILKDKTKEYVDKHMVEGRMLTLPQWVQKTQLKGDVRLRSEYRDQNGDSLPSRHRGRLRARLGLISRLNNNLSAGFGIATSSDGDPRSTNLTWNNSFERGDIRIDYAYAEYKPFTWLKIIGGKFDKSDYLWLATDMMWDSDINPTGGSIHLEKQWNHTLTSFFNGGSWIIDELEASTEDPALSYGQIGLNFEAESLDSTFAFNYFNFHHLRDRRLDNTSCTNSGLTLFGSNCLGTLDYDYRDIGASAEIGYRHMFNEELKRVAIFGDVVTNDWGPQKMNSGWAYGIKAGDIKVDELFDWQLLYQYTRLQKDAVPDIIPNSDRYEGETGVKGHKASVTIGLTKNATLGYEYLINQKYAPGTTPENQEVVSKVDLSFKF